MWVLVCLRLCSRSFWRPCCSRVTRSNSWASCSDRVLPVFWHCRCLLLRDWKKRIREWYIFLENERHFPWEWENDQKVCFRSPKIANLGYKYLIKWGISSILLYFTSFLIHWMFRYIICLPTKLTYFVYYFSNFSNILFFTEELLHKLVWQFQIPLSQGWKKIFRNVGKIHVANLLWTNKIYTRNIETAQLRYVHSCRKLQDVCLCKTKGQGHSLFH